MQEESIPFGRETKKQRLERYEQYQQRYEAFKMTELPGIVVARPAQPRRLSFHKHVAEEQEVELGILSNIRK